MDHKYTQNVRGCGCRLGFHNISDEKMKTDHKELTQEHWKRVQLPLPILCPEPTVTTRAADACLEPAVLPPPREEGDVRAIPFLSSGEHLYLLSSVSRDKPASKHTLRSSHRLATRTAIAKTSLRVHTVLDPHLSCEKTEIWDPKVGQVSHRAKR